MIDFFDKRGKLIHQSDLGCRKLELDFVERHSCDVVTASIRSTKTRKAIPFVLVPLVFIATTWIAMLTNRPSQSSFNSQQTQNETLDFPNERAPYPFQNIDAPRSAFDLDEMILTRPRPGDQIRPLRRCSRLS